MEGDRSPSRFLKSDWRKVCATDMLSPELNQLGWVVCGHFPAEIRSQMNIQRVNVLGAGISVLNMRSALDAVAEAVAQRRKGYICITGVHGVMEGQDEPTFLRILNNAFLCTPDGMPMVWMGKLRGHKEMSRVYGPDFMLAVCEWSQRSGCRHFFFGGADGVADALRESMTKRFPGLQVGLLHAAIQAAKRRRDQSAATTSERNQAGYSMGRTEYAQAREVHGGVFAQAGCDADGGRGRGV